VSIRVVLRNPRREVEVAGNRRVKDVLRDLDILPETVLVIRGDDLVTADQMLRDDDVIELRPVMSGGSEPRAPRTGHLRPHSGSPRASNALWLRTATPASRSPLQ